MRLLLAALALLAGPMFAQEDRPIRFFPTDPVNPCSVITPLVNNWVLGRVWECVGTAGVNNGTWHLVSAEGGSSVQVPNAAGGTSLYALAKIDSSGNAVGTTTSDTAIPVFIVISGNGTTGNATLAVAGIFPCQMDAGGATANHFIVASTSIGERCKDAGATAPTSGWVIGQAQNTVAANLGAKILLLAGYNAAAAATSGSSILYGNGAGGFLNVNVSLGLLFDSETGTLLNTGAPATSGTSILKGNGIGGFNNAIPGTDYAPATSGSVPLKGNGAGGFSNAGYADVMNLFAGCSGTQYPGADGNCHSAGGSGNGPNLPSFTYNSTTSITIGANCTATAPCNIINGANPPISVAELVSSCTAVLSGASASDTVFLSLNPVTGKLEFAYNGAETITLSGPGAGLCSLVASSINYTGPVMLYSLAVTASNWPTTAVPQYGISPNTVVASTGLVGSPSGVNGNLALSIDATVVPRYFTGSGAPAITCTAGRDFYTDTTGLNQYFCDALNTWKQTNGSRTDVQNWYVNSRTSGGATAFSEFDGTSVGFGVISMTGPNSISYSIYVDLFSATSTTDSMMFAKKASHTWSAAAGTVDVNYVFWNYDGGNPSSTYTMKIYVGCSISGAAFSYGAASTVSVPNPGSSLPVEFGATPALPGNCAADASMQFWIQRTDTQAGRIGIEKAEVVIRGN